MDYLLTKRRELLFNNLVLLGFDKVAFEKKYKIVFQKDLFVIPNKKAFEVVTHFMFCKLSEITRKNYNLPWPLIDREDERNFQKIVYDHFQCFSKENVVKFPVLLKSSVSSYGGDRFYELYFAFSSYVLFKALKKSDSLHVISKSDFKEENYLAVKKILQSSKMVSRKNFHHYERVSLHNQIMFKRRAKKLLDCKQQFKLILKENEVAMKLVQETANKYFGLSENSDSIVLNCTKMVENMKKTVQSFLASENSLWMHLASEIDDEYKKCILDGKKYNVKMPDSILEMNNLRENQEVEKSSEIEGRLCVLRFLKIFMQCLEFLKAVMKLQNFNPTLKKDGLRNPTACSDQNISLKHNLEFVENFNKNLEEIIPNMKASIQKYKFVLSSLESQECSQLSSFSIWPCLPVLEFDEEAVYKRITPYNVEDLFEINDSNNISLDICALKRPSEEIMEKSSIENLSICTSTSMASDSGLNADMSVCQNTFLQDTFSPLEFSSVTKGAMLPRSTASDDCLQNEHMPKNDAFPLSRTEKSTFKMNDSLWDEDSLNAVTMPELSFEY